MAKKILSLALLLCFAIIGFPQSNTHNSYAHNKGMYAKSYHKQIGTFHSNSYHVHYYYNVNHNKVQSPTYYQTAPANATCLCNDGTYSFSQNHRGACSHHGGVRRWLQ